MIHSVGAAVLRDASDVDGTGLAGEAPRAHRDQHGADVLLVCASPATAGCAERFRSWQSDGGFVIDVSDAARAGWLTRMETHAADLIQPASTLRMVESVDAPDARAARIWSGTVIALVVALLACAWPSREERSA